MNDVVIGTINQRPAVGVHYRLAGYVCGAGCFKPSPFEGWATFTAIFQQRPDQCRFAIAQLVPVFEQEPRGACVCWDLYDDVLLAGVRNNRIGGYISPPPVKWEAPNAEALIMKAMALYDQD